MITNNTMKIAEALTLKDFNWEEFAKELEEENIRLAKKVKDLEEVLALKEKEMCKLMYELNLLKRVQ